MATNKRIYVEGNYVIVDFNNGTVAEYPQSRSVVFEKGSAFNLKEDGGGETSIPYAQAGTWYLEDDVTAYTEATLRTFLRANTGNFNVPVTFSSLPDVPGYAGNAGKPLKVNPTEDGITVGAAPTLDKEEVVLDFNQAGVDPPSVTKPYSNTIKTFTGAYIGIGVYHITCVEDAAYFDPEKLRINGFASKKDLSTYIAVPSQIDGSIQFIGVQPFDDGLGNKYLIVRVLDSAGAPVEWSSVVVHQMRFVIEKYL